MRLLYLNLGGDVIAFSDPTVYDLARYAITFKENVYNRSGGGYTVFNHRTATPIDVIKSGVREYRIGWLPSKDAGSLFKVCKLIKGG